MPTPRTLTIAYADAEAFREEYNESLVHGGAFAATEDSFELRQPVQVRLLLNFCGNSVVMPSEVVHVVTPEMKAVGAEAGVGVQFQGEMHQLRARLEPLARACGIHQFKPTDGGRRAAPRVPAHVPARLACEDQEPIDAHTRNISVTGVLVAVPGRSYPVGSYVSIAIDDPAGHHSLELNGTVVREVGNAGVVSAVGIHFDPRRDQREGVVRFIESIQSAENSRRLGGISGSIGELGAQNLLQMLGQSSPAGTLTLRRGEEEGVIGFEKGLLCFVHLGSTQGIKALARMLSWEEGFFDFHARLDAVESSEPPLPMEGALLEAVYMIDELRRLDLAAFPPNAWVRESNAGAVDSPNKVQQAVLELARAGFTVQRILDVIPETDAEIRSALSSLVARGVLELAGD